MTLFGELAQLAEELGTEGSKLRKRAAMAEALTHVAGPAGEHADQAGLFCLYLAGQPFPEADPRKLNAGGAILSRALKEVSGADDAALTTAYRRHGDLGAAAYDLLVAPYGKAPAGSTLTLPDVREAFEAMATARSTAARFAAVERLLRQATALEAKYLLKLMLGDMRIGVKQSLVEEAIAVAAAAEVAAVRHAVMLEADLSRAVRRAFAGTLAEARMTLFHPLGFMLASPVETPEEAIERFTAKPVKLPPPPKPKKSRGKKTDADAFADLDDTSALLPVDAAEEGLATDIQAEALQGDGQPSSLESAAPPAGVHAFLEDKFDGMRVQLHAGDPEQPGRVALYSRNREDVTESFPEIAEAFAAAAGGGPVILDGELLGWDFATGKALPFAILGQRLGRKRVDNSTRRAVPVVFMAFDLLFAPTTVPATDPAAGTDPGTDPAQPPELLLPLPLRERRARLEALHRRMAPAAVSPLELEAGSAEGQGGLFAGERALGNPPLPRLLLSTASLVESAEAIDEAYRDARARANEGVMLKAADSPYLPGRRGLLWVKLKRELATLDVVITGAEFGSGRRSQLLSDYTFAVRGPAPADGGPAELLNIGKAYSGVTDVEIAELTAWLQAHTLEDFGHFRTVEPLRILEVAFNNIMRSDRHASGFALRFPRILRLRDDKPLDEIDTLARAEEIYQSQPDKGGE